MRARPFISAASFSRTGATILHGPHQVAQKSTRMGPPSTLPTSVAKFLSSRIVMSWFPTDSSASFVNDSTKYTARVHAMSKPSTRSRTRRFTPRPTSRRRRAMGQHFLSSRAVVTRLIDLFAPVAGEHVLEIGQGRRDFTDPLIGAGVRLTAIEMDQDLASRLASRHAGNDRLRLVQADVLTCDLTELAAPETRVIANLPYSITGEVLHRLLL